jgi:hypothetical protein
MNDQFYLDSVVYAELFLLLYESFTPYVMSSFEASLLCFVFFKYLRPIFSAVILYIYPALRIILLTVILSLFRFICCPLYGVLYSDQFNAMAAA